MTATTYTYRGMITDYWDLLRGDTSGWSSRPYFLQIIREGGEPALDVACGTGRLLLDYLAEGIVIDGVDISPEMIELCRAKADAAGLAPQLYVQPMQDLAIPRRYGTIIVPSSSFLHLTQAVDARRALQRFYDHLRPGGLVALSMRVLEPESGDEEWTLDTEAVRPADGALVQHWFRCSYDLAQRLQYTEDRYDIIKHGRIVQSKVYTAGAHLTWYTVSEARALVEAAGFVDVRVDADFRSAPATDADTSYIVVGKRT